MLGCGLGGQVEYLRFVGSGLLFFQAYDQPRLARLRVPEAVQEPTLRRRGDQIDLVSDELVGAISGQCAESSLRVEQRREGEHLGHSLWIGNVYLADAILHSS